jgi:hypothetical protein
MQPEDPDREKIQHPIPTRPPDPALAGEVEKVVGGDPLSGRDPNAPPLVNTGISSGPPIDHVGGAGLGKPPGEGDMATPATTRSQETRADDPQDRRDQP